MKQYEVKIELLDEQTTSKWITITRETVCDKNEIQAIKQTVSKIDPEKAFAASYSWNFRAVVKMDDWKMSRLYTGWFQATPIVKSITHISAF